MLKSFLQIMALAAAMLIGIVALAHAKDKHHGGEDSAVDRVEALQEQLQSPDLSERQQDRIEGLIDKIVQKYGFELPPPVDPPPAPEPKVLFKDDFNRADGPVVGNGWQQSAFPAVGLSNGAMSLNDTGATHGIAINYVDLVQANATQYQSFTLGYDLVANAGSQPNSTLTVSWSGNGIDYHELATHDLANPLIQDPSNPQHLSWTVENDSPSNFNYFVWKFEDSGSGGALVDNVTVSGTPMPTETFVGY